MEDRRGFIKSALLGAGGIFAADALAAAEKTAASAAGGWDVFEKRGSHERLTLAYQHVKIGLEKPFSVLSQIPSVPSRGGGEARGRFPDGSDAGHL